MRALRLAVAAALALCLGLPVPGLSQGTEGEATRGWFGAGLGGGVLRGGEGEGIALTGQAVLRTGPHLIRARGSVVAEILGDGVADLGLLYGRGRFGAGSYVGVSAGVGVVYFEECGDVVTGPCTGETSFGVPFLAEASWRPTEFFGLGAQAFANVNGSRPFGGIAVTLEVGLLR